MLRTAVAGGRGLASGRHRAEGPGKHVPTLALGLVVLAAVAVGAATWMTVAGPGPTPKQQSSVASPEPPAPREANDWIRANLPTNTRLLTDGAAAPIGYPTSALVDAENWHDFDYLLTTQTGTPSPDATVAPVWPSSTPVAVFDDVEIRHIAPEAAGQPYDPAAERTQRKRAGEALLQNRHLEVYPAARTPLTDGELDLRAAAVLTGLSSQFDLALHDLSPVAVEASAGTPIRDITVYTADTGVALRNITAFDAALKPDRVTVGEFGAIGLHWPLSFFTDPFGEVNVTTRQGVPMRSSKRLTAAPALLACVLIGVSGAPPAVAQPAPQKSAMLRGAHFSPDTPSVDVYLSSFTGNTTKLALSDVGYGDISDYAPLDPGQYTVGMRPHGADPSTPVVFSWTLDAKPGDAYTALAIGMNKTLQGRVLADDLTPPPAGQSRVRVVQAADNAQRADISAANGPVFGKAVPFTATTDYTLVSSGSWPVTAAASDNPGVATKSNATLDAGQASTIVLLDAPSGGLSLKVIDDAVGTDIPPSGPVQAGGGALAQAPGLSMRTAALVMTGLAALATMVMFGFTMRRSRIR